jgi:hypothetical protein
MTNEQINVAIAEACGWTEIEQYTQAIDGWYGYEPNGDHSQIPNYCNDLNAMHEAEETLDLQKAGVFAEQLRVTVYRTTRLPHVDSGSFAHVHAIASQRAEAFLRTIGKWEDGK